MNLVDAVYARCAGCFTEGKCRLVGPLHRSLSLFEPTAFPPLPRDGFAFEIDIEAKGLCQRGAIARVEE